MQLTDEQQRWQVLLLIDGPRRSYEGLRNTIEQNARTWPRSCEFDKDEKAFHSRKAQYGHEKNLLRVTLLLSTALFLAVVAPASVGTAQVSNCSTVTQFRESDRVDRF
jgi:hypothetical protein